MRNEEIIRSVTKINVIFIFGNIENKSFFELIFVFTKYTTKCSRTSLKLSSSKLSYYSEGV